jgi:hypothetical protein
MIERAVATMLRSKKISARVLVRCSLTRVEELGNTLQKKSTFTDFIACPEHLIEKKPYEEKHCINRGSAGGLLMGAVLNTPSVRI